MAAEEPKGGGGDTRKGSGRSGPEGAGKKKKSGGLKARVAELEDALERASAEAVENYDRWLRSRAEYENLKKRASREIEQVHQSAGRDLVTSLLPVLDDLEKAVEASRESDALRPMEEGLSLIYKGLLDALKGVGVRMMDPLGEGFDPNVHEAVMQAPSGDAEPGTVIQVLQNGYDMNGITLRAAKVIVAGSPEPGAEEDRVPEGGSSSDGDEGRLGDDGRGDAEDRARDGRGDDGVRQSGAGRGADSSGDEV